MAKKLNWVTMITPYKLNGEVDYECIDKIVEWYIENKVTAIFAVCQSSEIFYLTLDERIKIAQRVVKAVNGRVPVAVSGHVSDDIKSQIIELREMSKVGADAVAMISNRLAKARAMMSGFLMPKKYWMLFQMLISAFMNVHIRIRGLCPKRS